MSVGLQVCAAGHRVGAAQAPNSGRQVPAAAVAAQARDVRSRHFLVHTDLSQDEANRRVARLETLLSSISAYWGRPMQGVIECYVVRDLETFPVAGMDPIGIRAIRTVGGTGEVSVARVTLTVIAAKPHVGAKNSFQKRQTGVSTCSWACIIQALAKRVLGWLEDPSTTYTLPLLPSWFSCSESSLTVSRIDGRPREQGFRHRRCHRTSPAKNRFRARRGRFNCV